MAGTGTTRDRVWGSVTNKRGLHSKAEKRTPPPGKTASDRSLGWVTKTEGMVDINLMSDNHLLNSIMMMKLQTGQTSLSLLSLHYMEDEANDRGLNHETSDPF